MLEMNRNRNQFSARRLVPENRKAQPQNKSSKVSEYIIEDWAGRANNPLLFTCYSHNEMKNLLSAAGFQKADFFEVKSRFYESIPRLVERGVTQYQIVAYK